MPPTTTGAGVAQVQADPRQAIVGWAESQVGKPYVWGGTGPNGFDCSGLTMEAYAHNGITIPRIAAAQQAAGSKVDSSALSPADLCFMGTPAFHVGMYAGNGEIVVADHTGVPVRTRTFDASEWTGGFRTMDHLPIDASLTGLPGPLGDLSGVAGLLHAAEGFNAVAMHLTSSTWWSRIGKMALGLLIVAMALVFVNRKRLEQAGETAVKAAAVVAK